MDTGDQIEPPPRRGNRARCGATGISTPSRTRSTTPLQPPLLGTVSSPTASRSFTARIKEAALEKALALFLRPKLKRYGEIRRLRIDTTARRLSAELSLHGDPLPLEISSVSYRVQESERGASIVLFNFKLSKEWIQHLIDDRFAEVALPIPDSIKPLIE